MIENKCPCCDGLGLATTDFCDDFSACLTCNGTGRLGHIWEPESETAKVEPISQFLTGSSLVIGIEHSDRDIVCLFNNEDEINVFADALGSDKKIYGDSKFLSVRDGALNYLCTADVEFFYRFKAYSGVLELLQIRDKDQRVKTAKACLYWDGQKS